MQLWAQHAGRPFDSSYWFLPLKRPLVKRHRFVWAPKALGYTARLLSPFLIDYFRWNHALSLIWPVIDPMIIVVGPLLFRLILNHYRGRNWLYVLVWYFPPRSLWLRHVVTHIYYLRVGELAILSLPWCGCKLLEMCHVLNNVCWSTCPRHCFRLLIKLMILLYD